MRDAEINALREAVNAGQRVCAIAGCPLVAVSLCVMSLEGDWTVLLPLCWYHADRHAWGGSVAVRYARDHARMAIQADTTAAYDRACAYQRDAERALAERGQDPTAIQVLWPPD